MMRTQARMVRWMAALSLATTTAASVAPAAGQDWLAEEGVDRSVVADSTVEKLTPSFSAVVRWARAVERVAASPNFSARRTIATWAPIVPYRFPCPERCE